MAKRFRTICKQVAFFVRTQPMYKAHRVFTSTSCLRRLHNIQCEGELDTFLGLSMSNTAYTEHVKMAWKIWIDTIDLDQ